LRITICKRSSWAVLPVWTQKRSPGRRRLPWPSPAIGRLRSTPTIAPTASGAAGRYYRAALDLLADDDMRHGRLLLHLARTLMLMGEPDVGLFERARDGLLAAGDAEAAAEAETRLAEHFWLAGERDQAFTHLRRASELVDSLPPSFVQAHAIATASRFRMLAGEDEEAIRLGREALAMAKELRLDDVRAAALNNLGTARANLGDEQGLDDLTEAIRLAERANAPFELCRAKGNLAAMLWVRGQLARSLELSREAGEDAVRFGQLAFARWYRFIVVPSQYGLGDWDEAAAGADAFISQIEAGLPHYLAFEAYGARALIQFARDQPDAALADAEQALTLARRAADPQALLPTLARLAHIFFELGDRDRAETLAAECLSALQTGSGIGHAVAYTHTMAYTLARLGRGEELAAALRPFGAPWAHAAIAFCEGNPLEAAEILAEIGAVTDEAYARLTASRILVEQGRRAEADAQLRRALAFYGAVGASRYLREGESLLAASA